MSYSIYEGIDETTDDLRALRAIAKSHPDAMLDTLPNGERGWVAVSVRTQAIGAQLFVAKGSADAYLVLYVEVAGKRVYAPWFDADHAGVLLEMFRKDCPEAYEHLMRKVTRR